jgi:hypothetical protein
MLPRPKDPEWKGMNDHIGFIEVVNEMTRGGLEADWLEAWAGFLVLRLHRFWQINPDATRVGTALVGAVQAVIDRLPESSPARAQLSRVVRTLGEVPPAPVGHVRWSLAAYGSSLAASGHWALAHDVYGIAGIRHLRHADPEPP